MQVCGVRSGRAILLTSAAGIAIGIELHLARQIWLWLRTGVRSARGMPFVNFLHVNLTRNALVAEYPDRHSEWIVVSYIGPKRRSGKSHRN